MEVFEHDIQQCLTVLHAGGIILYPTDTIWGIGCDATNWEAVQKVYALKNRAESKSLIVLLAEERDVLQWVAAPDLAVFDYVAAQERPTTIIFEHALGLAENLVASDGSGAATHCKTSRSSANISGAPSPANFTEVSDEIKAGVDYIVGWRQDDQQPAQPSHIIRWVNGEVLRIR